MTITGQRIHITDLQKAKGIYPLKIGNARIIQTSFNLTHIITLSELEESIIN